MNSFIGHHHSLMLCGRFCRNHIGILCSIHVYCYHHRLWCGLHACILCLRSSCICNGSCSCIVYLGCRFVRFCNRFCGCSGLLCLGSWFCGSSLGILLACIHIYLHHIIISLCFHLRCLLRFTCTVCQMVCSHCHACSQCCSCCSSSHSCTEKLCIRLLVISLRSHLLTVVLLLCVLCTHIRVQNLCLFVIHSLFSLEFVYHSHRKDYAFVPNPTHPQIHKGRKVGIKGRTYLLIIFTASNELLSPNSAAISV